MVCSEFSSTKLKVDFVATGKYFPIVYNFEDDTRTVVYFLFSPRLRERTTLLVLGETDHLLVDTTAVGHHFRARKGGLKVTFVVPFTRLGRNYGGATFLGGLGGAAWVVHFVSTFKVYTRLRDPLARDFLRDYIVGNNDDLTLRTGRPVVFVAGGGVEGVLDYFWGGSLSLRYKRTQGHQYHFTTIPLGFYGVFTGVGRGRCGLRAGGTGQHGFGLGAFRAVVLNFTNIVLLNDFLLDLPFTAGDNSPIPCVSTLFASAASIYMAKLVAESANAC